MVHGPLHFSAWLYRSPRIFFLKQKLLFDNKYTWYICVKDHNKNKSWTVVNLHDTVQKWMILSLIHMAVTFLCPWDQRMGSGGYCFCYMMSVLSFCNFNLGHYFLTIQDKDFILIAHVNGQFKCYVIWTFSSLLQKWIQFTGGWGVFEIF